MRNKASLFNNSQNINIKDASLTVNVGTVGAAQQEELKLLFETVAQNAILNAGGRADEVRCYPGTREEVIEKVERWMDGRSEPDHRMLWLSGPAGAGKSAIAQTIAERTAVFEIHAANFFFFRGDNTRNHARPLVATLIYQLVDLYPALRDHIIDCLTAKPLMHKASIEEQFARLVASPIQNIHRSLSLNRQIVLIIDGLDECEDGAAQVQILRSLHRLVGKDGSHFRVLVASRAEPHLVMFFNKIRDSVETIFLNEDYRPRDDILGFVVAKFIDIKRTHHLAFTLSEDWPARSDVDTITSKSSSQFIYAATVMRFIEYSSDSPALSLLIVLNMWPSATNSPYAQLDAVYSYIFSRARDIRLIKWAFWLNLMPASQHCGNISNILRTAGYETIVLQSLFADISAIAQVSIDSNKDWHVDFYHASLPDYLQDKSRSGIYHVDTQEIAADLTTVCLPKFNDTDSFESVIWLAGHLDKPTAELSKSLLNISNRQFDRSLERPVSWDAFVDTIIRMYFSTDKRLFRRILQNWLRFACIHKFDTFLRKRMEAKAAYKYYELYCVTEKAKFVLSSGLDRYFGSIYLTFLVIVPLVPLVLVWIFTSLM